MQAAWRRYVTEDQYGARSLPVILAGTVMDMTVNTEYLQGTAHERRRRRVTREKKREGAGVMISAASRNKQELKLVLHALHRLLHQVHVLAAVAKRVFTARIEVYDPVHRHVT